MLPRSHLGTYIFFIVPFLSLHAIHDRFVGLDTHASTNEELRLRMSSVLYAVVVSYIC